MATSTFLPAAIVLGLAAVCVAFPWRRLGSRRALWLTTAVSVLAAGAVVMTVAVTAGGFLLGTPPGRWLQRACAMFVDHHQVPTSAGVLAIGAAAVIGVRVHGVIDRRARMVVPEEAVTVLSMDRPVAFSYGSGDRGGVVVSTGMLDALEGDERKVLFAHERAHVEQRHDRFLFASAIAAAVVPGLGRLAAHVRLATERCADDAAVRAVGDDRGLVARAIARAALAADGHVEGAMAFTGSTVGFRVRSLLEQPQDPGVVLQASALAAVSASIVGAVVFAHHLGELLLHICT